MKVLAFLIFLNIFFYNNDVPTIIHLAGDSTMSEKRDEKRPETGWGEKLSDFFTDNVIIKNYAKNGRSTRSFIEEGRWTELLSNVNKGDYVFIQFGHNDQSKHKIGRYTSPEDYQKNLVKFVNDTRQKNAVPVLLTSVVRRRFDENHKFYDVHGIYPTIVREVATEYKVELLDMHSASEELLNDLGEEKSKELFLILAKGEYKNYPDGLDDNTHFSEFGATKIAELATNLIISSEMELKKYLKEVKIK